MENKKTALFFLCLAFCAQFCVGLSFDFCKCHQYRPAETSATLALPTATVLSALAPPWLGVPVTVPAASACLLNLPMAIRASGSNHLTTSGTAVTLARSATPAAPTAVLALPQPQPLLRLPQALCTLPTGVSCTALALLV